MIEFFTLVDITKTNISRNNRPQGSKLTQIEWDFLRNQQRNWDTVIQLLGLRFQPMELFSPECLLDQDPSNFGFGEDFAASNNMKVWKCGCRYDLSIDIDLLLEDFNNIPIITGLNESEKFSQPCFSTDGSSCNLTIKFKR